MLDRAALRQCSVVERGFPVVVGVRLSWGSSILVYTPEILNKPGVMEDERQNPAALHATLCTTQVPSIGVYNVSGVR